MSATTRESLAEQRLRRRILDRDQYRCRIRMNGCKNIATTIERLRPDTRPYDPDYIISACARCTGHL